MEREADKSVPGCTRAGWSREGAIEDDFKEQLLSCWQSFDELGCRFPHY